MGSSKIISYVQWIERGDADVRFSASSSVWSSCWGLKPKESMKQKRMQIFK